MNDRVSEYLRHTWTVALREIAPVYVPFTHSLRPAYAVCESFVVRCNLEEVCSELDACGGSKPVRELSVRHQIWVRR